MARLPDIEVNGPPVERADGLLTTGPLSTRTGRLGFRALPAYELID